MRTYKRFDSLGLLLINFTSNDTHINTIRKPKILTSTCGHEKTSEVQLVKGYSQFQYVSKFVVKTSSFFRFCFKLGDLFRVCFF